MSPITSFVLAVLVVLLLALVSEMSGRRHARKQPSRLMPERVDLRFPCSPVQYFFAWRTQAGLAALAVSLLRNALGFPLPSSRDV